jgi:hypothetical protein
MAGVFEWRALDAWDWRRGCILWWLKVVKADTTTAC